MKKLMMLALLMYAVSCSNPEDHATDAAGDSTRFNAEGESFNTPPGGMSDSATSVGEGLDGSAAPAIDKKNANSKTEGTNRSYGTGKDSAKKQ